MIKKKNNSEAVKSGVTFLELLFLLFLGLKLANLIDWNWIWVFAPIWVPFALAVAIFGIAFLYLAVSNLIDKGRIDGRQKD